MSEEQEPQPSRLTPLPKSKLDIGKGTLVIVSPIKMPNAFHRLMQRLLLGFRWEKM